MKKFEKDIIGNAMLDYYRGNRNAKIIVHSPDFELDEIRASHYFRDYIKMPLIEKKALNECRGKILDAGAGAGSHSLYLQSKGFEIDAIDHSAGSCEVMRARGVKNVIHGNALSYDKKKYDTVLMLMNGIGITASLKGLDGYLKFLPGILNKGGQLIFDSSNLIYLYTDQYDIADIPLGERYYGQIEYQLEYESQLSDPFHWLFIDFDSLSWLAEKHDFATELIFEGENHQYLARLSYQS